MYKLADVFFFQPRNSCISNGRPKEANKLRKSLKNGETITAISPIRKRPFSVKGQVNVY